MNIPTAFNEGQTIYSDHSALSHQRRGFKGGMSVAFLNVNGIRSHIDEIKLLMGTLEVHTRIFFYKQLFYNQGSTRQGKKLSNFSIGFKTAKQFEKL